MVQVKASEAMVAVLGTLQGRAEVVDEQGAVIGYLTPAESPEEGLRRKAFAEYDLEKARGVGRSPRDGYTTEQVLAHLESLDVSRCGTRSSGAPTL